MLYEETIKNCEKNNLDIHHRTDDPSQRWFLIDLFDVILHIFEDSARDFYSLEYLWKQAHRVRITKKK